MRILIISPQPATWLVLFRGVKYEFHICSATSQLPDAISAFRPNIVLLDESIEDTDPVANLLGLKELLVPTTYFIDVTNQTTIDGLTQRTFADALLHFEDGPEQAGALLELFLPLFVSQF